MKKHQLTDLKCLANHKQINITRHITAKLLKTKDKTILKAAKEEKKYYIQLNNDIDDI